MKKNLFSGSNFKIAIELSWSKLSAWLIIVLGFVLEYMDKADGVFVVSVTAGTGLLVNKQYQDRKKEANKTDIENV